MGIENCLKHFLSLEEKDLKGELKALVKEAEIEDCTIFLDMGGFEYTLNYMIKDIYLSNKPINNDIRTKICIFNIVYQIEIKDAINYNLYALKRKLEWELCSSQNI